MARRVFQVSKTKVVMPANFGDVLQDDTLCHAAHQYCYDLQHLQFHYYYGRVSDFHRRWLVPADSPGAELHSRHPVLPVEVLHPDQMFFGEDETHDVHPSATSPAILHLFLPEEDGPWTAEADASLEPWLIASNLVCCDLSSHGAWISSVLRKRPQNMLLRSLLISCGGLSDETKSLLRELLESVQSAVSVLPPLDSNLFTLSFYCPDPKVAECVTEFLALSTATELRNNKLQTLAFQGQYTPAGGSRPAKACQSLADVLLLPNSSISALDLSGFKFIESDEESKALASLAKSLIHPSCSKMIKSLDLMTLIHPKLYNANTPQNSLKLFLDSVSSDSNSLTDLGFSVGDQRVCDGVISTLSTALRAGSLSKLQTLRFRFDGQTAHLTDESATSLVKALGSQGSQNVKVLDVLLKFNYGKGGPFPPVFWSGLIEQKVSCLICLRLALCYNAGLYLGGLIKFILWKDCPLLCLQLFLQGNVTSDDFELQLANALENNYRLFYIYYTWRSAAAGARARAFLHRNAVFRSSGLLFSDWVRPNTARLFMCGNAEVGKTTIRKQLLRLQDPAMVRAAKRLGRWNVNLPLRGARREPRTQGMELHTLRMQEGRKLVICDLAGQQEYHAFHHYFVSASSNDLFLVVCKLTGDAESYSSFSAYLEYWLKFLISHRSNTRTSSRPKVLVVVNFFHNCVGMDSVASNLTRDILAQYAEELDFDQTRSSNVLGIVALKLEKVVRVKEEVEMLLKGLIERRPSTPKLCEDILSTLLPTFSSFRNARCCGISGAVTMAPLFVHFSQLLEMHADGQVLQPSSVPQLADSDKSAATVGRFEVALQELHSQGQLVFFPDEDSTLEKSQRIVITNAGWFCNKLVGSLLAPRSNTPDTSLWRYDEVLAILREQQCQEDCLDEIVRYLERLELCYATSHTVGVVEEQPQLSQNKQHQSRKVYLFPALLNEHKVHWPERCRQPSSVFYGRRLKCQNTAKHLIPAGVFARLQVRMHNVLRNPSYKVGYCWASFVQNRVAIVVRFGGDRIGTSENHQWIDILLFCTQYEKSLQTPSSSSLQTPSSSSLDSQSVCEGEAVLGKVKELLYEICQGTFCSIPTVELEDLVLKGSGQHLVLKGSGQQDANYDVLPLSYIQQWVKEHGIDSCVPWPSQTSTEVVDLLLPSELEAHTREQIQTLYEIKEEFLSDVGASTCEAHQEQQPAPPAEGSSRLLEFPDSEEEKLQGRDLELWNRLKRLFELMDGRQEARSKWMDGRQEARFQDMMAHLKGIRDDVRPLVQSLKRMEQTILANCSTQLLKQMVVAGAPLPLYPYFLDPKGRLHKLKKACGQEEVRLHFLCESPATAVPHPVRGQKGKGVVVGRPEWLLKLAPVLIPTFKILCCAARMAAAVYLPGAHVFIPSPDFLQNLGFEQEALQHVILPKAMEAFVDGIIPDDLNLRRLQPLEQKQMAESIREVLKDKENVDMERDFGLSCIQIGEKLHWVCKEHCSQGHRVSTAKKNPFS